MLTIKDLNLDRKLSVGIALVFSSEVLHLYEAKHPNLGPRKAIESAIRWVHNPCEKTAAAVRAAARAAARAASVTYDVSAAYAASAAASAASAAPADYAAYAANSANAGAYAAYAAVNAARYAADATAVYADEDKYIHDRIVKILPLILEYKIENKQSFENAEKVLEHINDEDKVSLLFNLDILR